MIYLDYLYHVENRAYTYESVSYTHLDVYKRQVMQLGIGLVFAVLLTFMKKHVTFVKTLYYVPCIITTVALSLIHIWQHCTADMISVMGLSVQEFMHRITMSAHTWMAWRIHISLSLIHIW